MFISSFSSSFPWTMAITGGFENPGVASFDLCS
jgi:hypothetical protein